MGASPDAMLVGRDASGAEILMPVECKAPCPFQHCNGAGEATWAYVPSTSSWSTIPAHYYAQCQMTLLATGCDNMLLMRYMPAFTTAYQILRDDEWANALLVWLVAFNNFAIKAPTLALASCASATGPAAIEPCRCASQCSRLRAGAGGQRQQPGGLAAVPRPVDYYT